MNIKKLLPIILVFSGSLFAFEKTIEKTFEVDPGADFSLSSHKGHIQISTDQGHTVRISARVYVDAGEDDRAIEYTDIIMKSSSDYVSVDVDYNQSDWQGLWSNLVGKQVQTPYVDFHIVIPDDLNLRLKSHKSTFDVKAPAGTIRVNSHKGTGKITGVRNKLEMDSHKGEFRIEILTMRDLEIETHKGEMDLVIHKANDFSIRGSTHKGDIEVHGREVRYQYDERKRGMSISERFGKATHRIRLDTHKGSINLKFVD